MLGLTASDDSPRTADVVVIGGGIIGMSLGYQLARRRAGRVVVLDKASTVAAGSTGASSAILRLRYTHDQLVRLAGVGLEIQRNWGAFTGLDQPRAEFVRTGVLWMLGEDAATVDREHRRLTAAGAEVEVVDGAVLRDRFPQISSCGAPFDPGAEHTCSDHPSFLYEPGSGYCSDPVGATQDLCDAARREGADVRFGAAVTGVRVDGDRVRGVELADGSTIDAPVVVNAAGPWCNAVNRMAGVELDWPLRPTRIQSMYRVATDDDHGGLPMCADAAGGLYFRPESRGQQLLVGSIRGEDERELVADPDHFDRTLDDEMQARLLDALHHRLPHLERRGRITGIAGLYTINDDDMHPVVGPTDLEGFVVANGFSGHGFKLAPAVGGLVARWITGTSAEFDSDVDLDFLSPRRASLAVREKNVLA